MFFIFFLFCFVFFFFFFQAEDGIRDRDVTGVQTCALPISVVGQEGLEYYYDRYLRGRPGEQRVEVNAAGYPVPSNLSPTQPLHGYSLKVTLDRGLQQEGEKALLQGIERARAGGKPAVAGAFVA